MATVEAHLTQYEHNRALLPVLPASHNDWIATVTFYCAVHLVDAALAAHNIHPKNHEHRNNSLAAIRQLDLIAEKFEPLYAIARRVRYFANPTEWIKVERMQPEVFGRYLHPIEKSVFETVLKRPYIHRPIVLATPGR